jgi:hypothetical protein
MYDRNWRIKISSDFTACPSKVKDGRTFGFIDFDSKAYLHKKTNARKFTMGQLG